MDRATVLSRIKKTGLCPVIRASSGEEALAAVDAIRAGGVDVLELTMTVPGAVEIIRTIAAKCGDEVVLGAGTVLDAETARACILAGAQFIVSPIVDPSTISCCRTYSIPIMAGALTPTEIVAAWKAGADLVKVFPCNAVGGASYLRALKGPFPQIDLVPTGGVSLETAGEFLSAGAFALGAGGDLVDLKKLRNGEAAYVTHRARLYMQEISKARKSAAS